MTNLTIEKTIFLKAPPEHVWKFLTRKDKLAIWFHEGGDDLTQGGAYTLLTNTPGKEGEKMIWGEVLEFEPPHRLVHTFTHQWLAGVVTTCTWTLTAADGGTVLKLVHAGFEAVEEDAFGMAANHDTGWDEHFVRLRRVTC